MPAAIFGQLLPVAAVGYLAPYLHPARCELAALCALPRDPSRRTPTRAYKAGA
jgi:hypothetical protein